MSQHLLSNWPVASRAEAGTSRQLSGQSATGFSRRLMVASTGDPSKTLIALRMSALL